MSRQHEGHERSSHLSPVLAIYIFYRDASSVLLQLVNRWLNFTYSHAFRYESQKTNSGFHKNPTHDFRIVRVRGYLLDHSGEEYSEVELSGKLHKQSIPGG